MRQWTGPVAMGLALLLGCSGGDTGAGGAESDITSGADTQATSQDGTSGVDTLAVEDTTPSTEEDTATEEDVTPAGTDIAVDDAATEEDATEEDATEEDATEVSPCGDCPEGLTCHELTEGGGDPTFLCVDLALHHCDPCTDNLGCAHPDIPGGGAQCLTEDPAEGAFCRVPCDAAPCPAGSACQETLVGDTTMLLCFPEPGESCGCSEAAIAAQATTSCELNDGLCVGQRSCTEEGLSPCEPVGGGAELCDGLDNDCDGQTDEGLVYVGPDGPAGVGGGLPGGTGSCAGGVTICGDAGALVCSTDVNMAEEDANCDGEDDDCDGVADDDFSSDQVTTCGTGACTAEGTVACWDGVPEEDCLPALDMAVDEVCNDVDDDCDGSTDEDMPLEICNDVDDDCDGEIDEAEGVEIPEVCNGADDDCDGTIDEGMPDMDNDGLVDCADDDLDGDGVPNDEDNCPNDSNPEQEDEDGDDIGDACAGQVCGGYALDQVILVTTTEDELNEDGDCSLREAIQAANDDVAIDACAAGNGLDIISLGVEGATYTLTLAGAHEDQNQTGDLDLFGEVILHGCGADQTVLAGGQLDRILHIHAGASVQVIGAALRDGRVQGSDGQIPGGGLSGGFGGAIYNAGDAVVLGCTVVANEAVGGAGSDGQHAPGDGGGGGGGAGLGGAIYSTGTLTVDADGGVCSFDGNVALGGAGGKGMHHGSVSPFTGSGGGGGGANGGSGGDEANGNAGGFGGGGGGGGGKSGGTKGGDGGYGGGGGGGGGSVYGGATLNGGISDFGGGTGGIGCCSAAGGGGGGAGLGGAIFNDNGTLIVGACTFSGNHAYGGPKGSNFYGGTAAEVGGGYGGAIFDLGVEATSTTNAPFNTNTADTDGPDSYQDSP